ncbi:MAG: hypothetical protein LKM37_04165 [Bacteroidales bacterium]|jgi:F0F1-type ATP synthase gamma subunit|nr:hypothetical protein [Bacteroidales bacterium]
MKEIYDNLLTEYKGLKYIETTSDMNGKPADVQGAVIGFSDFAKAKQLAKKYNLKIEIFTKQKDCKFWYRTGKKALNAFERSSKEYGKEYSQYRRGDAKYYIKDELEMLKEIIENFDDFETIEEYISNSKRIAGQMENLKDNQLLIVGDCDNTEIVDKLTMNYEHNSLCHAIGLIERV